MINDPAAVETTSGDVTIGNPFSDPPLPFQAKRVIASTMPGGAEMATASFDVDVTSIDDPDVDPLVTSITERSIDNQGFAQIILGKTDTVASASSNYAVDRRYLFENTTHEAVAFSIDGTFLMQLNASVLDGNGLARAAGGVSMLFDATPGAQVNFVTSDLYAPVAIETGAGASVTDVLLTDLLGRDGFLLSAAVTAISTGTLTEAFFTASFDYRLNVLTGAGSCLFWETSFQQATSAEVTPDIAPVPLPASLHLLFAGLLGIAALRRKA